MIRHRNIAVGTAVESVWTGGEGTPLLLLHGAWGGAEMHWSTVWDALTERCRVIAPDFPGLGSESSSVPRLLDECVIWVEGVLDATRTPAAWIVGNSFGAAIAARVASRAPERCLGLVLVDGGPAPNLPGVARVLVQRWPIRPVLAGILRRNAYRPSILPRAFANPALAPPELSELLAQRRPHQFHVTTTIFLADNPSVTLPAVGSLVIWGAADRLPGSTVKTGQRIQASLPDARLTVIPDAGHLPQIEQPDRFVHAVFNFVHTEVGGFGK